MKYPILFIFFLFSLILSVVADESYPLTVASYNIRIGRGVDGVYDPLRIGSFLLSLDVDIAGLQEVDVNTRRNLGIDTPALLSMQGLYNTRYAKTLDFQGGKYGIMMMSRYPVVHYEHYWLPAVENEEPRKVQKMVVKLPDRKLTLIHSHLTHISETGSRLHQVKKMIDLIDSLENVILLGDINAEPVDVEIEIIRQAGLYSVTEILEKEILTFHSNSPSRKIDYIWISPDLKPFLVDVCTFQIPFSDHLPLIAFFLFD